MRTAKFNEVSESLRHRIRRHELPPGAPLPSENELSRMFGISRPSIRKALATLEAERLIVRRPGIGSFVQDGSVRAGRELQFGIGTVEYNEVYTKPIFDGARQACDDIGAKLVVTDPARFIAARGDNLDGLLMVNGVDYASVKEADLGAVGRPVMFLNRFSSAPGIGCYCIDYELESRRAVELMFRHGCRRIGYAGAQSVVRYVNQTRGRGYRTACAEHAADNFVLLAPELADRTALLQRFISDNRLDGVFVASGGGMLECTLIAAANLRLNIGTDLTVFCFDRVRPALARETGVLYADLPLSDMAECAIRYLAECAEERHPAAVREIFKLNFIIPSNFS